MSQNHLKKEELTKLVNLFLSAEKEELTRLVNLFLSVDKDNDGKISIKQLCKIMGQDFNDMIQNQIQEPLPEYSLIALIGTIRVDFLTFLEFYKKHELSKIFKQYNEEDESIERFVHTECS